MKNIANDIKNIFREGWYSCLKSAEMSSSNEIINAGRCEVDWQASEIKAKLDRITDEVQPSKNAANDKG